MSFRLQNNQEDWRGDILRSSKDPESEEWEILCLQNDETVH